MASQHTGDVPPAHAEECQCDPEDDAPHPRPRTPNDPYTRLTDGMIRNIQKTGDRSAHFHTEEPKDGDGDGEGAYGPGREGGRYYVDRHTRVTHESLLRGHSGHSHYGWMDEKYNRKEDDRYNTSRGAASVQWGPGSAGERTRSHLFGENPDRYQYINMYHRPPINYPGRVVMAHGRPTEGYYAPKYSFNTTHFGSSVPLNRRRGLNPMHRMTLAEYAEVTEHEQHLRRIRKRAWPEYSEYTDRYLLRTPSVISTTTLEANKRHVLEAIY